MELQEPYGKLIDYWMDNAAHPDCYSDLPSLDAISALLPGTAVKIGLRGESGGGPNPEHFWIEIVENRGARGFVGRIDNDLQPGWGVDCGDHIIFCVHHIWKISDVVKAGMAAL